MCVCFEVCLCVKMTSALEREDRMGEGAAWGRVRGVGGGEITKGTQIKKTVILDEKGRRGFNFSSAYPIAISVPLACDGAAGVF